MKSRSRMKRYGLALLALGLFSLNISAQVKASTGLIVTTDPGSASFVAGDNTTSTPVVIDPGLTVTDATDILDFATVSITGNFQAGQDVLGFTNNPSTMGQISGSYNSATGVLTLSEPGGATLAQYQAALDSVTYTNTAVTPNPATRTMTFSAQDAISNTSVATRTVTVADTDQTPIMTTSGGVTNYPMASPTSVTVDSGVTVSDLDNSTLATATVSIGSGFQSGDTLHSSIQVQPRLGISQGATMPLRVY